MEEDGAAPRGGDGGSEGGGVEGAASRSSAGVEVLRGVEDGRSEDGGAHR